MRGALICSNTDPAISYLYLQTNGHCYLQTLFEIVVGAAMRRKERVRKAQSDHAEFKKAAAQNDHTGCATWLPQEWDMSNFRYSCAECGAFCGSEIMRCARCNMAGYCSKECQVSAWKRIHSRTCGSYPNPLDRRALESMRGDVAGDVIAEFSSSNPCVSQVFNHGLQCNTAEQPRVLPTPYTVFQICNVARDVLDSIVPKGGDSFSTTFESATEQEIEAAKAFSDNPRHGAWPLLLGCVSCQNGDAEKRLVETNVCQTVANVVCINSLVSDKKKMINPDGALGKGIIRDCCYISALSNMVYAQGSAYILEKEALFVRVLECVVDVMIRFLEIMKDTESWIDCAVLSQALSEHALGDSESWIASKMLSDAYHLQRALCAYLVANANILTEMLILIRNVTYHGVKCDERLIGRLADAAMLHLTSDFKCKDVPSALMMVPKEGVDSSAYPISLWIQIGTNLRNNAAPFQPLECVLVRVISYHYNMHGFYSGYMQNG